MRKPLFSVLSLIAALGCGLKKWSRPQVGVTLLTETHVFYQNLRRGMQQAADSLGLDLKIVAGEGDLARQTAQVENFITQRMDAIVIAPVNSSGIASAIEEANRANIPVFTADIAADGGAGGAPVASDNRHGPPLSGAYVAPRLGGGGNLVTLHQPTLARLRDRVSA